MGMARSDTSCSSEDDASTTMNSRMSVVEAYELLKAGDERINY
jgi:hypothetical protein